jgi:hypothetical protein
MILDALRQNVQKGDKIVVFGMITRHCEGLAGFKEYIQYVEGNNDVYVYALKQKETTDVELGALRYLHDVFGAEKFVREIKKDPSVKAILVFPGTEYFFLKFYYPVRSFIASNYLRVKIGDYVLYGRFKSRLGTT